MLPAGRIGQRGLEGLQFRRFPSVPAMKRCATTSPANATVSMPSHSVGLDPSKMTTTSSGSALATPISPSAIAR